MRRASSSSASRRARSIASSRAFSSAAMRSRSRRSASLRAACSSRHTRTASACCTLRTSMTRAEKASAALAMREKRFFSSTSWARRGRVFLVPALVVRLLSLPTKLEQLALLLAARTLQVVVPLGHVLEALLELGALVHEELALLAHELGSVLLRQLVHIRSCAVRPSARLACGAALPPPPRARACRARRPGAPRPPVAAPSPRPPPPPACAHAAARAPWSPP
eukprot:scaffold9288_cov23-Tisochrysis_lutea.AAC.1